MIKGFWVEGVGAGGGRRTGEQRASWAWARRESLTRKGLKLELALGWRG